MTPLTDPVRGMCGRPRDPYPQSPLVRFRIYGSAAARRATTPRRLGHPVNPVRQLCPEQRPDRHRATSSPRRSRPGTASGAPNAVGARNGSQRVQPPSDVARPDQILLAGHGLPVRLGPMVIDSQKRLAGRPLLLPGRAVGRQGGGAVRQRGALAAGLCAGGARPARARRRNWQLPQIKHAIRHDSRVACVRGHEKVPMCGQVEVPACGQLEVPISRSSCRPGS